MPPAFDLPAELARHGGALRQLAGELVRGGDADDVVQETWLAALRRGPAHAGSVGGWLRTVLVHAAARWRRDGGRRARHEDVAARRRGDEAPDHAVVLAREELAARLLAAVRALDVPYRDAVWERFFAGRSPREIAAVSGVPLATVKSRLQRGLGMLRDQLGKDGADDRGDWRAGLVATFALHEGKTVAIAGGGVLVATWTKITAGAVAGVLAAFWWWPADASTTPVGPRRDVTTAAAPAATPPGASASATEPASAPASPPVERSAAAPPPAPDARLATIRGRCVDAAGTAVSGATAKLFGWLGRAERAAEWILEHGRDPLQLTTELGVDGTFELVFVPPPFTFSLTIDGERWARASKRWDTIEPGSRHELGDIVLAPGALVRGVLVEATGAPVAGVQVDARPAPAQPRERGAETYAAARSGSDGTFAFDVALPLGTYTLRVSDDFEVAEPAPLVLDRAGGAHARVVATRADVPTITGSVVDDADRPVAHVDVTCEAGRRTVATTRSRSDGTFVLRCARGDPAAPVRVAVIADALTNGAPVDGVAWGTRDVRVRIASRAHLTVFVGDADGRPLAGCTVRVGPADSSRWTVGGPDVVGRTGEDGLVTARYGPPGRYVVIAQFPASRGLRPCVEPITIDGRSRRVDVRFGTEVARTVRVVRADGRPAVGTRIELCELLDAKLGGHYQVRAPGEWFTSPMSGAAFVLVLDAGCTDERGRAILRGPRGRALALRVLGPAHQVVERDDVRLDGEGELLVTVATGARLRGRIEPPAAVAELKRLAGVEPRGAAPQDHRPRIGLRAGTTTLPPRAIPNGTPDAERFVVQENGSFDLWGVPPGTWEVHLQHWVRSESMSMTRRFPLGTHTFADGADVELRADLSALLPGTLRATVRENGAPLADTTLGVERAPDSADDWKGSPYEFVKTDANGRFELTARAGRYWVRRASGDDRATPTVELARGAVLDVTFELAAGTVQLRVLTADGLPARDVGLHVDDGARRSVRTDADGRATLTLPPGTFPVRVLPLRWQARERELGTGMLEQSERPAASDWLELGSATVVAGRTEALELRLPPEWAK